MHSVPYWRLSAYYFSYFAFLGVFSPYFGLYLQSLSFSAWDIGLVMSQMQLMRVFAPYFWGAIADRLGHRLGIIRITGCVAFFIFSSFFLFIRLETLLVPMAVFAFFWAASLPLVETLTFDHLREDSARYSRVRLWGSIGFIVAALVAGALLDWMPISRVLWGGMGTLVAIIAFSLLVPESPAHAQADSPLPVGEIVRQPHVRALLAACFAITAAHGALNIFYSIFLAGYGYNKSVVGGLLSLGVIAEIIVFFFMSRIMRRFSLRRILIVSFAAAVLRFVFIGWGVGSLIVLVLMQTLHGATFGSCHAAAIAAINQWFPGSARARGQALYASLTFGAGGLIGGLVSGWTWDLLGGRLTFAMSSIYALVGLVLVARWVSDSTLGEPVPANVVDTAGDI